MHCRRGPENRPISQRCTTMPTCLVAATRLPEPFKIYYELWGRDDAPNKVCFIMGLNNSGRSWEEQAKFIASLPDWQCVIFDNRGVGSSDAPSGRYTTSEMAMDTLELLISLEWTRCHVVGVSMGGMISQELVLKCPKLFLSCTLVSTHAGSTPPPLDDNYLPISFTTIPRIVMTKDPELRAQRLLPLLFPEPHLKSKGPGNYATMFDYHKAVLQDRICRTKPQPLAGAMSQIAAAMTHRVSDERLKLLAKSVPVMVVTGTIDNLVRPSNSFHMANVMMCRLEVLNGAGHALPSEQPEWFNKLLMEFMIESRDKATRPAVTDFC
ncbi:hypothetical protein SeMB42_g02242 [Synchytrium endobioticum]|uniref:AB hydrolase-1 domain-containing protein n=1 Tax=Synchytrium endobioticum TaxID=286115 RepID=A0A507DFL8_9FUNG|nr:hypothetical protein SeMB42_g02242 [Synchytrium endobioticum]